MHDVLIIGAGITGLSAANLLAASRRDVLVLERANSVGGKAVSEQFDGYLMEHGPSTINAAMPEVNALIADLGLDASQLDLGAGVRKRYLLDRGRLSGISIHPAGFLLSRYLPLSARISMMFEALRVARPNSADDESVFDFTARRFGRGFAEKVMDPMIGGIFMGDSRALSVAAVFPKLAEFERQHGSVIKGMIAARGGKEPGRRLFSWPGGMASLPRALAAGLGARVRTGVAVTRVASCRGGFQVETSKGSLRSRSVLLSVQPHVVAGLIETLDPAGAEAAAGIPAPPSAVVFVGYRRADVAHPLDGLGYLSTRGSGIISGVQFGSTMFPGRAPVGHVAITAYVGGARNPELARSPAETLIAEVHHELSRVLGIQRAPRVSRVRHWPLGLPQYEIGHGAITETLLTTSRRVNGLFLAGNYLGGVSVGNCILSGQTAARGIEVVLRRAAVPPAQRARQ